MPKASISVAALAALLTTALAEESELRSPEDR
jgi:hypothetical protein